MSAPLSSASQQMLQSGQPLVAAQHALCLFASGTNTCVTQACCVCRWEDIFDKGVEQKITELIDVR